ncbi:hypothetical protein SCB71_09345 [Herbiconiux sp. KACC 21604]|uniref:hypothetical protein n=1 Tax=unclassified Herbiconiux TaxID=2618217 RepID=UPI0014922B49|nr:hypothetical protein [Herbiconiux sp. SALV-R1]QJU53453.1 hypothetical protein HL652_07300 [Herbiconiux sp. SALV-R1]WPO88424.1 hypothetical protein SCB71_09345 [Herbiconiux sp. KACC 21604]
MARDDDKAQLGARLNGERDHRDPDGLLTLDDVTTGAPGDASGDGGAAAGGGGTELTDSARRRMTFPPRPGAYKR